MDDWTFDIGEFRVAAERSARGGKASVILALETDSLDVDVPLDVLKRLLAGVLP